MPLRRRKRGNVEALLLFTFEFATFDCDNLHFKYHVITGEGLSRSTSPTQSTHSSRGNSKGRHNFSHVFEHSLQFPLEKSGKIAEIFVEALEVDVWTRERYLGHSRLDIGPETGMFDRRMIFTREKGTIRENLERFFIGGHRTRSERRELNGDGEANILWGQCTETCGNANVSYSLIKCEEINS